MFPKPVHRKPPRDRFPEGLAELVVQRDRDQLWKAGLVPLLGRVYLIGLWPNDTPTCIALFVDGAAGPCSGRSTIQHVKTEVGSVPRIHREEMLVSLCAGHHLDTRAGANWATSHMDEQRAYLARLYPAFWREFIERNTSAHQP